MITYLTENAGLIVFLFFFTMFVGIALWAYWPANRVKIQNYGTIPLREHSNE